MSKGLLSLLWFIGVAFVLLIALGISEPFIWQFVLDKSPPATTTTLSSLLIIMIALLTLGIAAFGGGAYHILSRRIHQEASEAAEKEYLSELVRLRSYVCALWGRLYEGLQGVIPLEQLIGFANQAVYYGKQADVATHRLDVKTHEEFIVEAKNNYAMALALKGDRGTAKTAADLIQYMQQKIEKYPKETQVLLKETTYFVTWRLPRKENDTLRAKEDLEELKKEADEIQKVLWERRWDHFPKGTL